MVDDVSVLFASSNVVVNMAKPNYIRNAGKPITPAVVRQVRKLAKNNTPTPVIGIKIGRTENSVRGIAAANGISLRPTNQSPYNRRSS